MRTDKNWRLLGQGLAVLILSAALAACGGSSDVSSSDGAAAGFGTSVAGVHPSVSGTPPSTVAADNRYSFVPTVVNPTGAPLSFSIQNKPVWAAFALRTGELSGTPNAPDMGEYPNIVISASASASTSTSALPAFSIRVTASNGATSASSSSSSSGAAGTSTPSGSSSSSGSGGKSTSSSSSGGKSSSSSSSSSAGSTVPAPAAAVGYTTQTFGPAVTMGSNWYNFNFYGKSGMGGTQNSDGSVSIPGTGEAAICTAIQDHSKSNDWAGTVFGGGGYFEATFSFTGADDSSLSLSGWPSYWANDIENMSQNAVTALTQWPGQPAGYGNWIETDFFEYDHRSTSRYGIQIHNWYGRYGSQRDVVSFGPGISVPAGFDWSQPHKYGFLWVPATATSRGYAQMYLDRVQVGPTVYWDQYDPAAALPPPPVNGSTTVSVLDTRHLALIFNTDPHNPMTVYAVSVWQASAANNFTQ
jgi:hypothetical protein